MFCLKKSGMLGPGPAFTVRLEVDYKKVSSAVEEPAYGWTSAGWLDWAGWWLFE